MTAHQVRREPRAWFTPRRPDRAVRPWGEALARSGRRRILDVGCGGGRHVVYLVRRGLSVSAGDRSPLALGETARWLASEGLQADLVQFEMTALPFRSETFDAVLSVNVLHPARRDEARAAVHEAWRVLRPGGLFLAVLGGGPDCRCLLARPVCASRALPGRPCPVEPAPHCDPHSLQGLFAGFRILGSQRETLTLPCATGPPCRRGVNWRVWAERPVSWHEEPSAL